MKIVIFLLLILNLGLYASGGDSPVIQNRMSMEQIQKLTPENPVGSFGYSVATSRWGHLIIGSPSENRAYIYEYDSFLGTYSQQAILEPNDGSVGDKFGCSVATTGSTVVIGAYEHNNTGAIYIYKTNSKWNSDVIFVGKFVGDDSASGDKFGYSVDYDYSAIVVGAPEHNNKGAVYTFYNNSNWSQSAKLEIADGAINDKFGTSVALDYLYNKVIVGAYGANQAYLFDANFDWSILTKSATLTASDSSLGDRFGISVDIDGTVIVVGADSYSSDMFKAGQAYVYTSVLADTNESATLSASDTRASAYFGRSVAIDDSKIVVGSRSDGVDGAIYLFEKKNSWIDTKEDKKLKAIDTLSKTKFGDSVAIHKDTVYSGYSSYSSFILQETILCNVAENSMEVVDINATDIDNDIALYRINGGADQALFSINESTGAISFKSKPDFENPKDADRNNIYELYVSVVDSQNNLDFTHVFISVSDIKYEHNLPRASSYKLKQSFEAQVVENGDYFGNTVALNGNLSAILSEKENNNAGVVYLYDLGVRVARLGNENVQVGDAFGKAILIENNTVYISAEKNGNGKVFVYEKGNTAWEDTNTSIATILADVTAGARFGHSLASNNGTLIIGAPLDNSKGSVYVFEIPPLGWGAVNESIKLTALDGASGDYFGQDVAIHNNTILVGAYQNSASVSNSGAAYIFTKPLSGWVNSSNPIKLIASDASVDDALGYSVAIYNNTALLGSFVKNANKGKAYIYEKAPTGWRDSNESAILSAEGLAENDYFSQALDIQGDLIAIGAPGASATGSVYLYDKPFNGWVSTNNADKILDMSNVLNGDFFGKSLQLSNEQLIVGSPYSGNVKSGEAHLFKGSSSASLPSVIMYLLN